MPFAIFQLPSGICPCALGKKLTWRKACLEQLWFMMASHTSNRCTNSCSSYPDRHAAVKCLGWGRRKKAHGEAWCQAQKRLMSGVIQPAWMSPSLTHLSQLSYKAGSKRLSCKLIRLHQTLAAPFPWTGTETGSVSLSAQSLYLFN